MKTLIDVAAVDAMKAQGISTVHINENTLLTPAARDEIVLNNMQIQDDYSPVRETTISSSCYHKKPKAAPKQCSSEVNTEMIYKVLSHLQEKGLLEPMLEACKRGIEPYKYEYDTSGFKLVRGDSIETRALSVGDTSLDGKIRYREVIGKSDNSEMTSGILTIEDTDFSYETKCQSICHVLNGCITVKLSERVFEAKAGDIYFIPDGVKCCIGSSGLAKVFYTSC